MPKPSYSSLLGFQVQFSIHDLAPRDQLQLVYNLIEALPRDEKIALRDDLDRYLEASPHV